MEAHLGMLRISEVALRLRPKLKQNQSCKDRIQEVSDRGNGPEKALNPGMTLACWRNRKHD